MAKKKKSKPVKAKARVKAKAKRRKPDGLDVAAFRVDDLFKGRKAGSFSLSEESVDEQMQGFLAERKTQEEIHLATLTKHLGRLPRQDLILAAHDVLGVDGLRQFATNF
jgi:hypothetical protein